MMRGWLFSIFLAAVVGQISAADECTAPITQDILTDCKTIKGDLILEKVNLTGLDLTMADSGCIRLKEVILGDQNRIIFKGKLTETCKDGQKSTFAPADNMGLCGEILETIAKHFPNWKFDPASTQDPLGPECARSCTRLQALNPYYRCSKLTENTDISSWFTSPELKWHADRLITAESTLIIANLKNVETISLPQATDIYHLILANNTRLKVLNGPKLIEDSIQELSVVNSPKIEEPTLRKLYRATIRKIPLVDCHTTNDTVFSKVSQLGICKRIIGPFIFDGDEKVGEIEKIDFPITEINGCVRIVNTQLDNLQFLDYVKIHNCTGKHILHDNHQLCFHDYLDTYRQAKAVNSGRYRNDPGCSQPCSSSKYHHGHKRCSKYFGELIITDDYSPYKYMELKEIEGQLIIDGTNIEQLMFPKLQRIEGEKAPLLQVTDNAKLKMLSMPRFPSILEHSSVRPSRVIVIENNPQLSAELFLNPKLNAVCYKNKTKRCYYDKSTNIEKVIERSLWFYVEPILMVVLIILAHLLICLPDWWLKKGKDDYEEQQQEEWNKEAEKAMAGSDSTYREMMKMNRNGRPSGILRVDKTQPDVSEEESIPNKDRSNYGTMGREKKKKVTFQTPTKPQPKAETPKKEISPRMSETQMESISAQAKTPEKPSDGSPKTPPLPENSDKDGSAS